VIALSLTLDDLLFLHDESVLDRTAVVFRDRQASYRALIGEVEILASRLLALGVRRGDRVVVHLAKSCEEIVAMFACWRIGAVAVNVNVQWTLAQLNYVVDDAGARVLLADGRRATELGASGRHTLERVIVKGDCPAYAGFEPWPSARSEPALPKPRVLDSDLAAILYTSGSTGAPKGVMLTHLNLLLGARSVARYLGMRASDRVLSLLPLSFDYGLNQLLTTFLLGARLVLAPIAMPSEVVKLLAKEEVTGFAAVPPVWLQVVRYLEEVEIALPALRYVTNSGGKIPEPTLRAMPKVFPGAQIFLMYGLTEAFRSTFLKPERFADKLGSMGQAIPDVEVFVVAAGRGLAGPGEEGELVHRGSLISRGYWNKPDATAEKIRVCPELRPLIGEEKVVYSGDMVRIDADGDLWFVGRTDSMIKSMGFRLSPTEVEEIVHKSGLVREVVAFGVDDELAGQVVHVCGANEGAALDADALMNHCRAHMPHYMLPRAIHSWPGEMPRTASGKIDVPAVVRAMREKIARAV
jgi:acyl-CoA ligase (AMP-forming) (exosortase A-associated)